MKGAFKYNFSHNVDPNLLGEKLTRINGFLYDYNYLFIAERDLSIVFADPPRS